MSRNACAANLICVWAFEKHFPLQKNATAAGDTMSPYCRLVRREGGGKIPRLL
jgi:hypothetical protein